MIDESLFFHPFLSGELSMQHLNSCRAFALVLAPMLLYGCGSGERSDSGILRPAPDTFIDSGPAGTVSEPDAVFTFSSNTEGSTFRCRLDQFEAEPCASPQTYPALQEGMHTFSVMAVGPDGWVDPTPATRAWTVDLSAPAVMVTSGPDGPTNNSTPTFEFTITDGAVAVECSLDGAFEPCVSPFTSPELPQGEHTFTVRASDILGNRSQDSRTFIVDLEAPQVMIDDGPSGLTNTSTPTFAFTVEEGSPVVECSTNGAEFFACTSPITLEPQPDGPGAFFLRAFDEAGNEGSASRMFVIDTGPPEVTMTGGPMEPTNNSAPTFTFTVNESDTSISCSIGSGAAVPCRDTYTSPSLADGPYTFTVEARDAAGNVGSASRTFTVDTIPPMVSIVDGPPPRTSNLNPTFRFTTVDAVSTRCSMGGTTQGCTSPFTTPPLTPDGLFVFEVEAIDAAGNVARASQSVTIDTTPPTITLLGGPHPSTNDNTPAFTFDVTGAVTVECSLGSGFTPCTSPHVAPPLADNTYTFSLRATDDVGNRQSATRAFTVDTVPPDLRITTGPSGAINDSTPTFGFTVTGATRTECSVGGGFVACSGSYTAPTLADGAYTFEVRASDAAGNIASQDRTFTIDTVPPVVTLTSCPSTPTDDRAPVFAFSSPGISNFSCRLGTGASFACSSPHAEGALADGTYTFSAAATDEAGNVGSESCTFRLDTSPVITHVLPTQTGSGEALVILGRNIDRSGVTVRINGVPVTPTGVGETAVPSRYSTTEQAEYIAVTVPSNITTGSRTVELTAGGSSSSDTVTIVSSPPRSSPRSFIPVERLSSRPGIANRWTSIREGNDGYFFRSDPRPNPPTEFIVQDDSCGDPSPTCAPLAMLDARGDRLTLTLTPSFPTNRTGSNVEFEGFFAKPTSPETCVMVYFARADGRQLVLENPIGRCTDFSGSWSGPTVSVDGVGNYSTSVGTVTVPSSAFSSFSPRILDVDVEITFRKTGGTCAAPSSGSAAHRETNFRLRAPTGQEVILAQPSTWFGDAPTSPVTVVFDQSAHAPPDGVPEDGRFQPNGGDLSTLSSISPVGTWTLQAGDTRAGSPLCVQFFELRITAF